MERSKPFQVFVEMNDHDSIVSMVNGPKCQCDLVYLNFEFYGKFIWGKVQLQKRAQDVSFPLREV